MTGEPGPGWRRDSDALIAEVARIPPGESIERALKLRIERAPGSGTSSRIFVEARSGDGPSSSAEASLRVADCAGNYRTRLAVLRDGVLQAVRDMAEEMQQPDPVLPIWRFFPATGGRSEPIANAERLAAGIVRGRGGDPEMAGEHPRFLIQRWTAELAAYARQDLKPGLCAGGSYMLAGYREGLRPITRRIEALHDAAAAALDAARSAARSEGGEELGKIARRVAKQAGLESGDQFAPVLRVIAAARASLAGERKLEPELAEALSLIETAAWLAEADKRGQGLANAIEQTFGTLAAAHKESCVCAF
jgi:hypothetical protein